MKNRNMDLQFFETGENATTAMDLQLVIPVDFTTGLSKNINGLFRPKYSEGVFRAMIAPAE